MHKWYKGRAIASIVHALRDVRGYQQQKRQFLRWLRRGQVVISVDPHELTSFWPISATYAAIVAGAELAVFSGRLLRGLEHEQKDDFWKMDWSVQAPAESKFDPEYFKRYGGFERYDQYYVIDGEPTLVGGVGLWLGDSIHMMRKVLSRPYSMQIKNRTEDSVAKGAAKCILEGIDGLKLDLGNNAWALSISYE
jgi:hypothetical protein